MQSAEAEKDILQAKSKARFRNCEKIYPSEKIHGGFSAFRVTVFYAKKSEKALKGVFLYFRCYKMQKFVTERLQ